jgi:hypothetical protein
MAPRTPHRPQGVRDFVRLLVVCTAPVTVVCAILGYGLYGGEAVSFSISMGLLIGLAATLVGWWFARQSWPRAGA